MIIWGGCTSHTSGEVLFMGRNIGYPVGQWGSGGGGNMEKGGNMSLGALGG